MIGLLKKYIEFKAIEKNFDNDDFQKEFTGFTPLMLSAVFYTGKNQLECAKILIKNGANVNCKDFEGNSLLHIAARYKS